MSMQLTFSRRQFQIWLLWMAANALGWALGFSVQLNTIQLGIIFSGLVIALAQWLVLQKYAGVSAAWVLAGLPGWAVAWLIALAQFSLAGEGLSAIYIKGIFGGSIGGILQALLVTLLLKPRLSRFSTWALWLAFSLITGINLYWFLFTNLRSFAIPPFLYSGVVALLAGAVYGALSGVLLPGLAPTSASAPDPQPGQK